MADPVSLAASITGLVAVSCKVARTAKQIYDSGKDASSGIMRIKEEMDNLHLIFCQVQELVGGRKWNWNKPKKSRLKMVPVNHLVTILTGCMVYFSSLDEKLSEVAGTQSTSNSSSTRTIMARVKWMIYTQAEVAVIIENLERQKSSLHLMLTILNCATASEAEESLEELNLLVEKISEKVADSRSDNNELAIEIQDLISTHCNGSSGRLPLPSYDGNIQDSTTESISFSSSSRSTARDIDFDDRASVRTTATYISLRSIRSVMPLWTEELKNTRPYKLLRRRGTDSQSVFSKDSLATRGGRWSMLSDMSLGDLSISEISVIELPISLCDLYNPAPYQVAARGPKRKKALLRSVKWSSGGRLHNAIADNNLVELRSLLNLGADIEEKNDEGITPVLYAAGATHSNRFECCKLLLVNGAAVDSTDSTGRTPLSYAVEYGRFYMCELLLQNGAAVDSTDSSGRTPLSHVATNHSYDALAIIKLLLKNGAAVNSADSTGRTPLSYAAHHGRYISNCKLLLEKGAAVDSTDSTGRTPLSYAAAGGKYDRSELCKLLLENGAAVNSADSTGRTPLSYAAEAPGYTYHGTIRELLEHGAAVDSTDSTGRTPLSYAATNKHLSLEICKMLLEKGAAVDSTDSTGRTPLSYAAHHGRYISNCKLLLEKGAAVDSTDSIGRTPLSYAAENHDRVSICELLLKNGTAVDSTDFTGRTPLSHAAEHGYQTICELLLEKGAAVDLTDSTGRTPLSHAAEHGKHRTSQYLLKKGASIALPDITGRTPLDYARSSGNDIENLLSDHETK